MSNSQVAYLNSAMRNAASPAELVRQLLEQYLRLDEMGQQDLALALIMEIGAVEALRRNRLGIERHQVC
ncbi:hypothetical protein [Defluviimonas sp. SAOS-178_SWC]|uniref:hypothetical protein n=1 Tax=Defluviimonas sp. SAOS-178_SWC TaxID=3121287 RepID=UPI0032216544